MVLSPPYSAASSPPVHNCQGRDTQSGCPSFDGGGPVRADWAAPRPGALCCLAISHCNLSLVVGSSRGASSPAPCLRLARRRVMPWCCAFSGAGRGPRAKVQVEGQRVSALYQEFYWPVLPAFPLFAKRREAECWAACCVCWVNV